MLVWLGVLAGHAVFLAPPSHYAAYRKEGPPPGLSAVGETLALCSRARRQSCVVDGDTLRFRGSTIRLADIDAPETRSPRCAWEAELGRRAMHRLLELVNAGPFEVIRSGDRDVDVYGRQLRRVERHGRSLGEVLVAEGLARPWDGARRSWCG